MTIAQTWVIIQFKYIPSGKTECKSWYLNKKLYFHARAFDLPSASIKCIMFIVFQEEKRTCFVMNTASSKKTFIQFYFFSPQKQPLEVFYKKSAFKNFAKFTGKFHILIYNKAAGLRLAFLFKRDPGTAVFLGDCFWIQELMCSVKKWCS